MWAVCCEIMWTNTILQVGAVTSGLPRRSMIAKFIELPRDASAK